MIASSLGSRAIFFRPSGESRPVVRGYLDRIPAAESSKKSELIVQAPSWYQRSAATAEVGEWREPELDQGSFGVRRRGHGQRGAGPNSRRSQP